MSRKIETTAPAGDDEQRDDVDLVRAVIYFLAILFVGLVAVVWALHGQRDDYRQAVDYGVKEMPKMAVQYDTIKNLLREFKESGADAARDSTATWMTERYQQAGIQPNQVTIEPWKNRPYKDYEENSVQVKVSNVQRKRALQFVWNVETRSTNMRTLEISLNRNVPRDSPPETDNWTLTAVFGYRTPR